jgi:hypothetical protein
MGGKSSTTTSKTSNNPPAWAKPALTLGGRELKKLYQSGEGFNSYQGDRVADFSNWTSGAMNDMASGQTANMLNNAGEAALSNANSFIKSEGLTDENRQTMNFLERAKQGEFNPGTGGFEQIADMEGMNRYLEGAADTTRDITKDAQREGDLRGLEQIADMNGKNALLDKAGNYSLNLVRDLTGGQSDTKNYLEATAKGEYLEGSPFLQDLLARESQKIADTIGSQMAGMGRYGSAGAHQGVLGQTLGDFRLEALNDNYGRERQLMYQAANDINAAELARSGLAMQGTGQMADIGNTIYGNRLAGEQALEGARENRMNIGLAGAGQLGDIGNTIYGNRLTGEQSLYNAEAANSANRLAAASQISDISSAGRDAALAYSQLMPQLQAGTVAGSNLQLAMGQMKDQQAQREIDARMAKFYEDDMADWNRVSALLSGGMTAAGPYGTQTSTSTTTQPSSFNPFSVLGLFGGMMQSDRRVKTDIEKIGETPGGLNIYSFRFVDGISRGPVMSDGSGRNFGVIAQEVMETQPEAVMDIGGVLHVDYGMIR